MVTRARTGAESIGGASSHSAPPSANNPTDPSQIAIDTTRCWIRAAGGLINPRQAHRKTSKDANRRKTALMISCYMPETVSGRREPVATTNRMRMQSPACSPKGYCTERVTRRRIARSLSWREKGRSGWRVRQVKLIKPIDSAPRSAALASCLRRPPSRSVPRRAPSVDCGAESSVSCPRPWGGRSRWEC